MARSLICVGDRIDHGGVVVAGSPSTDIQGRPVARLGDPVVCDKHGPTSIVTGDWTVIMDGTPAAREHDKTACGGTLIASQSTVFVEDGRAAGSSAGTASGGATTGAAAAAFAPSKPPSPVCAECLLAGSQSGAALLVR